MEMFRDGNEEEEVRSQDVSEDELLVQGPDNSGDNSSNDDMSDQYAAMDAVATGDPILLRRAAITSVDREHDPDDARNSNLDGQVGSIDDANAASRRQEPTSANASHSLLAPSDQERPIEDVAQGAVGSSQASSGAGEAAGEAERSVPSTSRDTGSNQHAPPVGNPHRVNPRMGDMRNFDRLYPRGNTEPTRGAAHSATRRNTRIRGNRQPSQNATATGKKADECKDIYRGRSVDNLPPDFGSLLGFGPMDRLHFLRVMRQSEREEEMENERRAKQKGAARKKKSRAAVRPGGLEEARGGAGEEQASPEAPGPLQ